MAHEGRIIEMFPDSFNKLREKLVTEHQDLWQLLGWSMVHDHFLFVEGMNAALEPYLDVLVMPEAGIDICCQTWLRALERKPKVIVGSVLDMQLDVQEVEKKSPFDSFAVPSEELQEKAALAAEGKLIVKDSEGEK